jgi:hypothetical protein
MAMAHMATTTPLDRSHVRRKLSLGSSSSGGSGSGLTLSAATFLGTTERVARLLQRCYRRWKAGVFFRLLRKAAQQLAAAEEAAQNGAVLSLKESRHVANLQWNKLRMQQALVSIATERKNHYTELMSREIEKDALLAAKLKSTPLQRGGTKGNSGTSGGAAAAPAPAADRGGGGGGGVTLDMLDSMVLGGGPDGGDRDDMIRRSLVRSHERLGRAVKQFWDLGFPPSSSSSSAGDAAGGAPTAAAEGGGEAEDNRRWKKKRYVAMLIAFYKALMPTFKRAAAQRTATLDYINDARGEKGGVSWANFKEGLFELADSWVDDISVHK